MDSFPLVSGIDPVYSPATPDFDRRPVGEANSFAQDRDPRFALTQLSQRSSAVRNPYGPNRFTTTSGSCYALAPMQVRPSGETILGISAQTWRAMPMAERIETLMNVAPDQESMVDAVTKGSANGYDGIVEAANAARVALGLRVSSILSARQGAATRVSGDAANAANAQGAAAGANAGANANSQTSDSTGYSRAAVLVAALAAGVGGYMLAGSKKVEKALPAGKSRKRLSAGK